MDPSPKGREICELDGTPSKIHARGKAITTLGEQMISSASMLESIADGASGQEGLAVDKLQEVVGEVYKELKLAGERYKPTGPVLVTYAEVLAEVQPLIKTIVEECVGDWSTYSSAQREVWNARMDFYPTIEPVDGCAAPKTPEELREDAVKDAQIDANSAHDTWEANARQFDTYYDTWEDAFDTAAAAIGDATDGGIEDGFWDDVDGFVAVALKVLQWVGIALAILGVIIGGPFIAALAAIVAIATLLLTIYSFARGNSDGWDLAFAIVGVIPFGSMGKLFNGGKLSFLNDVIGGLGSKAGRLEILTDFRSIRASFNGVGVFTGMKKLFLDRNGTTFVEIGGNISARLFTGTEMGDIMGESNPLNILGAVWGDGMAGNVFGTSRDIVGSVGDLVSDVEGLFAR